MYQPTVFCIKLQLHFGGDVNEITVSAYGGAEPTVNDLMNVIERDFRVPRVLQNLVFHGQELHMYTNEPLSRFGIKNGGAIRLVGRMARPEMINQINSQYNTIPTYQQTLPSYYSEAVQFAQNSTVGTQYESPPPLSTPKQIQSNNQEEKPPVTPKSST